MGVSLIQFHNPNFRSEFRQQLKPFWVFPSSASEEFSDSISQTPLARAAAHEHWLYGLCVIAWRLNGRHG